MELIAHFRMLARYNRLANERLFDHCVLLDEAEYRKERRGSFGGIHALLNHILLGDRIWMARFQGAGRETPPLNTVLFHDLSGLREARIREDSDIERFFEHADADLLSRSLRYVNYKGKEYVEDAAVAIGHFFNHQTHHRGQVCVMLSQTSVGPPSLDLHRMINP